MTFINSLYVYTGLVGSAAKLKTAKNVKQRLHEISAGGPPEPRVFRNR